MMSRRGFVRHAGLFLAVAATPVGIEIFNPSRGQAAGKGFKPHAFLEIAPDGTVTVWVGQTELGQGTHTGIAMLLADEVGADWRDVRVRQALAGEPFKDPLFHMQLTGGSTSIRHRWDLFRQVGAAAREMLIQAAAQGWRAKPAECRTQGGKVIHSDGRSLGFGDLTAKAASLPVPAKPAPKSAKDYAIIGSKPMRVDIPAKVAGEPVFGMDFKVPGMCVAVAARPPAYGAKPQSFDAAAAKAIKGVIAVVPLEDKVAVLAETTHAALQGREALAVQWSAGSHPDLDDARLEQWYQEHLARPGVMAQDQGDAPAALGRAAQRLEATYRFPYLAHATLEPTNCTAQVEKGRCRVWAPTQNQSAIQFAGSQITGLPPEKIEVMTTYAGGGFGRRGEHGVVVEALALSKALGRPVKVVWTRDDEFRHDFYRPAALCQVQGGLDAQGRLTAWAYKVATPSIMSRVFPQMVKDGVDRTAVEGVPDMDYALPHRRVEFVKVDLPVPVGFWRSVGHTFNTFVVECFMDELAAAAGKDPLAFRLEALPPGSRPRRVLEVLARKAGWGGPVPPGRGRGLALSTCYESTIAHVAEVSVDRATGAVKVHKLVGVIDCGTAVFPDAIMSQMESGAVMGLSAAFKEKVRFAAGGVATANYDDYPLLTMTEVPEIEAHIAASGGKAGGVGEPPVVTAPPAVANAIFAACGVRLRELPFDTAKLKQG